MAMPYLIVAPAFVARSAKYLDNFCLFGEISTKGKNCGTLKAPFSSGETNTQFAFWT